jgi:hypothetical protein
MEVTQTQKPLSERERERLTSKGGVPQNIEYWARGVGFDPNPSQQQIATARAIFDMPYLSRHNICVWEDQLVQRTNVVNYSWDWRNKRFNALKY